MRLVCLVLLSASGLALGAELESLRNANHIFNAVHASMRQWDSSVHHNGMSFFVASVPRGTQFYHGRSTSEPVRGMQWLAFEAEHSLVFARPPWSLNTVTVDPDWTQTLDSFLGAVKDQRPLGALPDSELGGYLHTFRTKHSLSLLYIDGMSAAKSQKGTLDSTIHVLLNGFKGRDTERAVALCSLAQDEWSGRIDGFIRMETGFEVILCDFEAHLTTERIARTAARGREPRDDFGVDMPYYRAVASRFDGIGGHRVSVDYDDFVTAFAYDVDLFRGEALPRLSHVSNDTIARIRRDVTRMVMSHPVPAEDAILRATNWQAVSDMVVSRYSGRLESFLAAASLDRLQIGAEALLQPHIDYSARNRFSESVRCAEQYVPASESLPLAGRAIRSVAETVCSTLLDTLEATDLDSARKSVADLMAYLRWPVLKRCRNCEVDEVCYIPMFPSGRKQDYENPQCQSSIPRQGPGESYWLD